MVTSFTDLSPARRFWTLALLGVSLGLVAAAQRDLHHRPADQILGSRLAWRLVCLNALGALAYFRFGRRRAYTSASTSAQS